MRSRLQRGLTLIELMVGVAILGIIATLAAPNMADFIDRQRLVSQTEAVADLLQVARSEAIRHSAGAASDVRAALKTGSGPSDWYVGLSNDTTCTSAANCVLNEGGSSVTRFLKNTECSGCTVALWKVAADNTRTAATTAELVFRFNGLVAEADRKNIEIEVQSPRSKKTRITVSRIGRLFVCTPDGTVPNYPVCPS